MNMTTSTTIIERQIGCSSRICPLFESLANALFFPLAYLVYETLAATSDALPSIELSLIISSGLTQAFYLARNAANGVLHHFIGHLIGPLFYSLSGILLIGERFWDNPNHFGYWIFAVCLGLAQAIRKEARLHHIKHLSIIFASIIRNTLIIFMFYLLTVQDQSLHITNLHRFFSDPRHQFITIAILFLSIITGMANAASERHLDRLSQITAQFKMFAEWLLGRELLERSMAQPEQLTLQRRDRTIMFIDIRGFTKWSEQHSPEEVVKLLRIYYQIIEKVFTDYQAIKFKLSADEAMAIFPEPTSALQAALIIRSQMQKLLDPHQLGIGIGIHHGAVVEGLLGSNGVKFYDVIGDTVNTAKRLESAAQKGEIIISTRAYQALSEDDERMISHIITVKGKRQPLQVYSLPACDESPTSIDMATEMASI